MKKPTKPVDQNWAGALKRYRNQFTSVQLQGKALECRDATPAEFKVVKEKVFKKHRQLMKKLAQK